MSAFNGRLLPKEILGLPAYAIMAAVMAMACGIFTFLAPVLLIKILVGFLTVFSALACVLALVMGDRLVFLPVIFSAYRESRTDQLIEEKY